MATIASNQYLTFNLEDEVFALDIAQVREVLEFRTITKVPRTPNFMRGIINLRGSVVPVLDLKLKFGMSRTEKNIDTCVIIVEIFIEGEMLLFGVLADSVCEVLELDPAQIQPPPRIGTKLNTEFLKGMGKQNELFIMILDIDKVFAESDLLAAQEMTKNVHAEQLEVA